MFIPKVLVLDLDGTLLNDNKEISERTIKAIERLYTTFGIIPVIATARPLEVAKFIANKGGEPFECYIIANNGATLENITKQEYIINKSLTPEQIGSLIDICEAQGLEYKFMTKKQEIIATKDGNEPNIDPRYAIKEESLIFSQNPKAKFQEIDDTVYSFAISGSEEQLKACQEVISDKIKGLEMSTLCKKTTQGKDSEDNLYFDITPKGVTKASAIAELAKHLQIPKERIIAFGDSGNDIEMLKSVGIGVAMKNATQELKDVADMITAFDNNNDGVGIFLDYLYKYLKLKQLGEHRKQKAQKRKDKIKEINDR